jgi:hypothetical protein
MSLKHKFHVLEPSVGRKSGEITDMTSLPASLLSRNLSGRLKKTGPNIGQGTLRTTMKKWKRLFRTGEVLQFCGRTSTT